MFFWKSNEPCKKAVEITLTGAHVRLKKKKIRI